MMLQIISLTVAGLIALYYLRKEHIKSKSYFGEPRKYSKKEQAILDHYMSIYKPIPKNKNLPSLQRDGFELEDVSLTATQIIYDHPLPAAAEIDKLRERNLVKLVFIDKD
jgi:hypothetical protein